MNKDLEALNQLIGEAINEEKALTIKADELALQSKQFADYLAAKKHNDEKLEMLWNFVKDHMIENGIYEHENEFIKLKLSQSGRYRLKEDVDIDDVSDELCDVKKTLNNKKVKAYFGLNGFLPEGVESTGYILRKTLK